MRSRPGAGTCRAHPAPVGLPPSLGRASSGPRNPAQHQLQASPPVSGSAQRGAEPSKLQLSPLRWVQPGRMWVWPQDPPNMNEGLHRLRGDCPLPCVPSATTPRLVRRGLHGVLVLWGVLLPAQISEPILISTEGDTGHVRTEARDIITGHLF